MKISVRLALYSVILTAIAVILCCIILLITTANNDIKNAVQNGVAELRMLNNSFTAEMDVVGDDNLSETAKRSVILYVFRKYTDASVSGAHYILTDMKQTLYNDCPIDPRPLLPYLKANHEQAMKSGVADNDPELWPYAIAELNGRRYLTVGHWSASLGDKLVFEYELFIVRDITDIYDGITALAIHFAIIALITIVLSAALMVFFIRRVLRPLGGLQKKRRRSCGWAVRQPY